MFAIPSPTTILIGIAIAGTIATGSFYEGHHLATLSEQAAQTVALKDAQTKYAAKEASYNQIAQQLEDAKNAHSVLTQTITKSVNKYIDRPIYKQSCFDPSGLHDANRAIAGKSADPSQPPATMPAANTP